MPKDTKTLGNSKARACESLGFVHKKGCARVLTQPRCCFYTLLYIGNGITLSAATGEQVPDRRLCAAIHPKRFASPPL